MEAFSVPLLLGIISLFVAFGVVAAVRRKDDFWEDKPKVRRKASKR
jgi:hypothetical protein